MMLYSFTDKNAERNRGCRTWRTLASAAAVLLLVILIASGAGAAADGDPNVITSVTVYGPGTHTDALSTHSSAVSGTVDVVGQVTYGILPNTITVSAALKEPDRSIVIVSSANGYDYVRGAAVYQNGYSAKSGWFIAADSTSPFREYDMFAEDCGEVNLVFSQTGTISCAVKMKNEFGEWTNPASSSLTLTETQVNNKVAASVVSAAGTPSKGWGSGISTGDRLRAADVDDETTTSPTMVYLQIQPDYVVTMETPEGRSFSSFSAEELPSMKGADVILEDNEVVRNSFKIDFGDSAKRALTAAPYVIRHAYSAADTYVAKLKGANAVGSAEVTIGTADISSDDLLSQVTTTTVTAGALAAAGDSSGISGVVEVADDVIVEGSITDASKFVYVYGESASYKPDDSGTNNIYSVENPRGAVVLLDDTNVASGAIIDLDEASKTVAGLDTFVWSTDESGTKLQFTLVTPAVEPKTLTLKNIFGEKTWEIFRGAVSVVKGRTFTVDSAHIGKDISGLDPSAIHLVSMEDGLKTEYADGKLRITVPPTYSSDLITLSVDGELVNLGVEDAEETSESNVSPQGICTNPSVSDPIVMQWTLSGSAVFVQLPSDGIRAVNSETGKKGIPFEITLDNITVTCGDKTLVKDTDYEITDEDEIKLISPDKTKVYTYTFTGEAFGDANGDEKISGADATEICYWIMEDVSELEVADFYVDVDINNRVSVNDARVIVMHTLGL